MSDETIWPLHTPIKHKTMGYVGWIHATTSMKEIFTGDVSVSWQYTIRVEGDESLKVAPAQDLEWIQAQAPFPAYLVYTQSLSDKNYLQETRLHMLGYQMSDLNSEERWKILKFVAIPMLNATEVTRTIIAVISSRIARPANAEKFRHAFKGWNNDLNTILEYRQGVEDEAVLQSMISNIQRKLLDLKFIEAKDVHN